MTIPEPNPLNVLLTGLPRSGTTLTCSLLNTVPDCVALSEPMPVQQLAALPPAEFVSEIVRFFDEQRERILREGRAASKSRQGRVPTNTRSDPDQSGVRKSVVDGTEIEVGNITGPAFSVFIKHPAFFTAALPVLVERFDCYALVRNPLSVIISWGNSGMAVGKGRLPAAERADPALAAALAAEPDTLERQLILLDYCFHRYRTHLPGRVLRYEEIIASGGKALALFHPAASCLDEPLQSRNPLFVTQDPAAAQIAKRLLERDSPCWDFYDRTAVEALLG